MHENADRRIFGSGLPSSAANGQGGASDSASSATAGAPLSPMDCWEQARARRRRRLANRAPAAGSSSDPFSRGPATSADVSELRRELGAPPFPHCVAMVRGGVYSGAARVLVDSDRLHEVVVDGDRRARVQLPTEQDGWEQEEGEEDDEADAFMGLWRGRQVHRDERDRPVLFAWPLGHSVTALRELAAAVGAASLHPCLRVPLMRGLPADSLMRSIIQDAKRVVDSSGSSGGGNTALQASAEEHAAFCDRTNGLVQAAAEQTHDVLRLSPAFMHHLEGRLNPSQMHAVVGAATRRGFTLVQGPPGTGKSTAVLQLLNALHLSAVAGYHESLLRGKEALKQEDQAALQAGEQARQAGSGTGASRDVSTGAGSADGAGGHGDASHTRGAGAGQAPEPASLGILGPAPKG